MFVILVYDVNSSRCAKVMKICKKYLHHVQRSVFEGMITESKLKGMRQELERNITSDADSVCIYQVDSLKYTSKLQIGICDPESHFL